MSYTMHQAVKDNILDCLQDLSDLAFQERVWVRGEGPEVSSFEETYCGLFTDTLLTEMLEGGLVADVLGPDAARELRRLEALMDEIPYNQPADVQLRHPLWPSVREVARQAAMYVERWPAGATIEIPDELLGILPPFTGDATDAIRALASDLGIGAREPDSRGTDEASPTPGSSTIPSGRR